MHSNYVRSFCPLPLFGPEFWNSSICFAQPRLFLDLIFSWYIIPAAETLISCLEYPSEMSHHDTLHVLKTLDTLWRHTEDTGISIRDPRRLEPGEVWRLPASIQQPPVRWRNALFICRQNHTSPQGFLFPGQKFPLSLCPSTAYCLYFKLL